MLKYIYRFLSFINLGISRMDPSIMSFLFLNLDEFRFSLLVILRRSVEINWENTCNHVIKIRYKNNISGKFVVYLRYLQNIEVCTQ